MGLKVNRTWAERKHAIAILAEYPNMTGAEAFARLFNGDAAKMQTEAKALTAGIVARKRAELERLQAEVARDEQASKVQAEADAKAAAVDARLNAQQPSKQETAKHAKAS